MVATAVMIACGDDASDVKAATADAARLADAASTADAQIPDAQLPDALTSDTQTLDATLPQAGGPSAEAGQGAILDAGAVPECTTATGACVAASGVRGGVAFSCHTNMPETSRTTLSNPAWRLNCYAEAMEISVQVEFPIQAAGTLTAMTPSGTADSSRLKFYVHH